MNVKTLCSHVRYYVSIQRTNHFAIEELVAQHATPNGLEHIQNILEGERRVTDEENTNSRIFSNSLWCRLLYCVVDSSNI